MQQDPCSKIHAARSMQQDPCSKIHAARSMQQDPCSKIHKQKNLCPIRAKVNQKKYHLILLDGIFKAVYFTRLKHAKSAKETNK